MNTITVHPDPTGNTLWKIVTALTLVLIVTANVISIHTAQQRSQDAATAKSQRMLSARNDCRSTIISARNDVIAKVTLTKAAADHAFYEWLIAAVGQDADVPVLLQQFKDADQVLGETTEFANQVPNLDVLVNHGGFIDGVHYAPCPKVS